MSTKRQQNQLELAFPTRPRGESAVRADEGPEVPMAEHRTQSPAMSNPLIEEVLERENLKKALKRVQSNKGAPGIDGVTVDDLPDYLRKHWPTIRMQLLEGTYKPQPVRRVEIPKPNGGTRKLGIYLGWAGNHRTVRRQPQPGYSSDGRSTRRDRRSARTVATNARPSSHH